MSIKSHLEQTIANLEAEKAKEVAVIKDKVTREIILPYNKEIDTARDKAIAEKQGELNSSISACQELFAKEKKKIMEAAEDKKTKNASAVIATETYAVTSVYDKEISYLKDRLQHLEK